MVDYVPGNLSSVKSMLFYLGFEPNITSNKDEIENASMLILPCVGSFHTGMKNFNDLNLIPLIKGKTLKDKTSILKVK